jgi:hypothetical protein
MQYDFKWLADKLYFWHNNCEFSDQRSQGNIILIEMRENKWH